MVLPPPPDWDVVGLAEDELEAAFQVFFVRRGRVLGRKGWVVDRVEELDRSQLIGSFLEQLYMERQEVPARVLVAAPPGERDPPASGRSGRRRGPGRVGRAAPGRAGGARGAGGGPPPRPTATSWRRGSPAGAAAPSGSPFPNEARSGSSWRS